MSFPNVIQLTVNGEVFFPVVGVEVRSLGRYLALVPAPGNIELITRFFLMKFKKELWAASTCPRLLGWRLSGELCQFLARRTD